MLDKFTHLVESLKGNQKHYRPAVKGNGVTLSYETNMQKWSAPFNVVPIKQLMQFTTMAHGLARTPTDALINYITQNAESQLSALQLLTMIPAAYLSELELSKALTALKVFGLKYGMTGDLKKLDLICVWSVMEHYDTFNISFKVNCEDGLAGHGLITVVKRGDNYGFILFYQPQSDE